MSTSKSVGKPDVVVKKRKPRAKKVARVSVKDSTVSTDDLVVKGGYVSLNDYFKVDLGVYKIMERNIRKGVNVMLLGPTGVK